MELQAGVSRFGTRLITGPDQVRRAYLPWSVLCQMLAAGLSITSG